MKQITYQAYRTDPLIREQLEREARRARAKAIGGAFVMLFRALFRRPQPKISRALAIRAA